MTFYIIYNENDPMGDCLSNVIPSGEAIEFSTTWTLTKRLERKLDGNYTRMMRAVLNKSW